MPNKEPGKVASLVVGRRRPRVCGTDSVGVWRKEPPRAQDSCELSGAAATLRVRTGQAFFKLPGSQNKPEGVILNDSDRPCLGPKRHTAVGFNGQE